MGTGARQLSTAGSVSTLVWGMAGTTQYTTKELLPKFWNGDLNLLNSYGQIILRRPRPYEVSPRDPSLPAGSISLQNPDEIERIISDTIALVPAFRYALPGPPPVATILLGRLCVKYH